MNDRKLGWFEIGAAVVATLVAIWLGWRSYADWRRGSALRDAFVEYTKWGPTRDAAFYAVDRGQKALPGNATLKLIHAALLLASGDAEHEQRAIAALEELTEKHEEMADARVAYGLALLKHALGQADARDRDQGLERAAQQLRAAVELAPSLPETHAALGVAKLESGKLDEALQHFDEAERSGSIPTRDGLVMVYHDRGVAKLRKGRSDEAARLFMKAIQTDPYSQAPRSLLTYALRRRLADQSLSREDRVRATAEATAVLEQVAPLLRGRKVNRYVPEALEAPLRNAVAVALAHAGDPAGAIAELERALRLKKNDPVYAMNLAEALARLSAARPPAERGDASRRAGEAFLEAASTPGVDPPLKALALESAGYHLAEAKVYHAAAKCFEQAIAISGQDGPLLQSLAVAYDRWGPSHKAEAMKTYEQAIAASEAGGPSRIALEERLRKLRGGP